MDNRATALIDHARLEALLLLQQPGRPAILESLFELFVGGTPGLVERMRAAVAARDRSALRIAAHTLKSSSANLGAIAFAEESSRIEIGSQSADWASLQSRIDGIANEVPTVTGALRKAIEDIG